MNRLITLTGLAAVGLLLVGYPSAAAPAANAPAARATVPLDEGSPPEAVAMIHNAEKYDHKITGTATFTQLPKGVKIVVKVEGLTPGKHGIHIHQKPDLSAPDLSSAGPHYNPDGKEHHHGGPEDATRHAGDLGNIEVNQDGTGTLELEDADLSVNGKNSVVGHSIIIHEKEDDLKTDPSGNSGARIAGGVIEIRKSSGKPE